MKTTIKFLIPGLVAIAVLSCTKSETLDVQRPYEYTDAYYEALRAYKQSDHSICYVWFGDYGTPTTMGLRFAGIPDSVDVISLWGGVPKKGTFDRMEMDEMRAKKGTKVVGVKIIRIAHRKYRPTWAYDVRIPSYMDGYNGLPGFNQAYKEAYDARIAEGGNESDANAAGLAAGHAAGTEALIVDMNFNSSRKLKEGSTEENPEWEYPEWCVLAGNSIIDTVREQELDGYDLDFEPEGDALDGPRMVTFLQYLSQFIGPASPNPEMILAVDGAQPPAGTEELCTYWVSQHYGSPIGENNFNKGNWKNSQLIFTESMEANWATGGYMMQMAAFQPSKGGRKGGFGAYHCERDYNTTDSGSDNVIPYGHLRRSIQLQNPAIIK